MDAELAALASTGGATVVTLMATDAWHETKAAVGSLWRRVHPERAETVEADLLDARDALLSAQAAGDSEAVSELTTEWQRRLTRLLAASPDLVGELRRVLEDELGPALAATGGARAGAGVEIHAHVSGNARSVISGRDTHIRAGEGL